MLKAAEFTPAVTDPEFAPQLTEGPELDAIVAEIMGEPAEGTDAEDRPYTSDPTDEDAMGPMEEQAIQNAVRYSIDEAVQFSESELSQDRINTQTYYNGRVGFEAEDGRSQVVVSRVRDTVRHLMTSIMRVFLQSDQVCEFQPFGEDDVQLAKDVTAYCNDVFHNKNEGYKELYSAASDSLVKKVGVVKVWWDDTPKRITNELEDIDEVALQRMLQLPNAELIDKIDNGDGTFSVTIVREFPKGQVKFETIPPENFHVNRMARGPRDAFIMLHRENKRVSDMVELGFDYDTLIQYSGEDNSTTDIEDDYRREYVARDTEDMRLTEDMSSKPILVTDTYIYLDCDGDGVAELKHFITVGVSHEILFEEVVDEFPFALFYSEIEPHAFYPRCIADMAIQDQDAATSLMRGVLDNVQLSNNPQREIDENNANVEDAMNSEIGALIRSRKIGSVRDLAVPFIGGQTLPVMEYLDNIAEARSGVTKVTSGLHPDVMQSTTKTAVSATVNAAQAMGEMICRNLAETGMTRLMRLIVHLTIRNATGPVHIRNGAEFKTFDPRLWHPDLDMDVNVGLGTGQPDEKLATLAAVATKQETMIQMAGPVNPFSGWSQLRHTYSQMLIMSGFKDVSNFFPEWGPEQEQQWQQQQQQKQQQQKQNPEEQQIQGLIQVEKEKNQGRMQIDAAKLKGQAQKDAASLQVDMTKARMDDDRERDRDAMRYAVDSAQVEAQYGATIDKDRMNAEVTRERNYQQFVNQRRSADQAGQGGGTNPGQQRP